MNYYLRAAGEEEQEQIRVELTSDIRNSAAQVAMYLGRRSFPTQTPPSTFTMSTNPDGSMSIEHSAIHIRVWTLSSAETEAVCVCVC